MLRPPLLLSARSALSAGSIAPTSRLVLAAGLLLALGGCTDESSPSADGGPATDSGSAIDGAPLPDGALPPPPPDCSPRLGVGGDGDPRNADAILMIGTRDEMGFHPWEDGATVPFMWGFQGGTMIMPVLRVEGSALEGDPICVHSRIVNAYTDDGPAIEIAEFLMDVEVHAQDGAYETNELFDQVSYDSPAGREISLEATISLDGLSVTGSANVVIGPDETGPPPTG